ncbi:MAG: RdgB/HAM1 family non-canonical purine NTP pyrophosphatase [Coprobacillus sp.]|nr:RdgB/HAM1 family non-canonical purine NTP pyrophosphatase [Coprobacillus sp.]
MKEIVVASTNEGKIKEIRAMLNEIGIDVKSIKDAFDEEIEIEENGQTFKDNALIKAQTICNLIHKPTLADDSGLEVKAMNGAPGIYSARFMGHDTSYDIKNQAIIDAVQGKEKEARFVCAMVLCIPNEEPIFIEEYFNGEINDKIEGENGFGYDPIFYVPELGKTSASLTLEEKNQYSHRAKALKKLYQILKEK